MVMENLHLIAKPGINPNVHKLVNGKQTMVHLYHRILLRNEKELLIQQLGWTSKVLCLEEKESHTL